MKKVSRDGRLPAEYEIKFNQLAWTAFGINSFIQMSFATILQHGTDTSALSQKITVETSATTISFLTDPPREVTVNTIFEISLKVGISGGTPLPEAPVS